MATKKDNTLIYLGIAAFFIYWLNKKKPINMPSISPEATPPIQKSSPGMPSSGTITTPGGKVIEDGNVYTSFPAPPEKNYTPTPFDPGPVDVAPVEPIYLTDYATNSNNTGTPAPPYSYPMGIFQDDLFLPPAPTDPFSVNTLPTTGVQQLTPSYATIKDINPYQQTLDYDCPGCSKNTLSGYMKPVPNIC
jgi:hypothetical protein